MTHEMIRLIFLSIFIFCAGARFSKEALLYKNKEQEFTGFIAGVLATVLVYGLLIALILQI